MPTANLCIQCKTPDQSETGTFLFFGSAAEPFCKCSLASPVFPDLASLAPWMAANGWKALPYDPNWPVGRYAKPSLSELESAADKAGSDFDAACRPHFCDGRWGAYRAIDCNKPVPDAVASALDAYHAATHAFYLARDGAGGFLGGL